MKKGLILLLLLFSCSLPQLDFPAPVIPGPDSCAPDVSCKHLSSNIFTIGSFNVQVFGKAKREKPEVMDVIVAIIDDFDLIALQEIRDVSLETIPFLQEKLDEYNHSSFAFVESPRLGRSSSKEQYVFFYD